MGRTPRGTKTFVEPCSDEEGHTHDHLVLLDQHGQPD